MRRENLLGNGLIRYWGGETPKNAQEITGGKPWSLEVALELSKIVCEEKMMFGQRGMSERLYIV
jgi:hypothetical protein